MKKALFVIMALIVVGVAFAVTYQALRPAKPPSTSTSTNTSSNTQTTAAGKVTMTNMLFTPSQITIKKGDTVTWTNKDDTAHTVITDTGNGPTSEEIKPGSSYSYTFNDSGSYQYHCSLHSAMHGTIVVN